MSRFVAWMNGLSVFQIKVSSHYTGEDFDEDLRQVLRRAGCKGEKICFIMDESNILDSAFLERMNTLLANAEIPGLFEGDDFTALMSACREGSQRDGLMLDTNDELYRWFNRQIARNLHVVFTMNPPTAGLGDKAATSPALFNRCVLDWFGDWSDKALYQVGLEMTNALDLEVPDFVAPPASRLLGIQTIDAEPISHRAAVAQVMVMIHKAVYEMNTQVGKQNAGVTNYATPRHFLEL